MFWTRSVQATISFLNINFNIMFLSVPRSSNWPLSLRLPTKILYAPLSLFHTCLLTCPSHASWFDEEYKSRSCQLCSFVQPPVALFFGPSILFSNTPELRSSPCLIDHTYSKRQNYSSLYTNYYIFGEQTGIWME